MREAVATRRREAGPIRQVRGEMRRPRLVVVGGGEGTTKRPLRSAAPLRRWLARQVPLPAVLLVRPGKLRPGLRLAVRLRPWLARQAPHLRGAAGQSASVVVARGLRMRLSRAGSGLSQTRTTTAAAVRVRTTTWPPAPQLLPLRRLLPLLLQVHTRRGLRQSRRRRPNG